MATATKSPTEREVVPAFCHCSSRQGFFRSNVTGFWNCSRCGHPAEVWWRGQKARIDALARKGRCSKDAGVRTDCKPRRCDGYNAE